MRAAPIVLGVSAVAAMLAAGCPYGFCPTGLVIGALAWGRR